MRRGRGERATEAGQAATVDAASGEPGGGPAGLCRAQAGGTGAIAAAGITARLWLAAKQQGSGLGCAGRGVGAGAAMPQWDMAGCAVAEAIHAGQRHCSPTASASPTMTRRRLTTPASTR